STISSMRASAQNGTASRRALTRRTTCWIWSFSQAGNCSSRATASLSSLRTASGFIDSPSFSRPASAAHRLVTGLVGGADPVPRPDEVVRDRPEDLRSLGEPVDDHLLDLVV